MMVDFMQGWISSPLMFMLLVNVLLLIVGCLMTTGEAILILAPLLMPVAEAYGYNKVVFGIIMILNLEIGFLTPPVGLNLIDTAMSVSLLAAGCLWGGEGAAASRIVYGAGWLLLYARFLHRLVGYDLRGLLAIYAKSALATLAALVPLAMAYLFWAGPDQIALPLVFSCVAAGVVLWAASLVVLRHPALHDLLGLAGHLPLGPMAAPLARLARASAG